MDVAKVVDEYDRLYKYDLLWYFSIMPTNPSHDSAEFFKIVRANTEPTDRKLYDALFNVAADLLFRSEVQTRYISPNSQWHCSQQLSPDYVLDEQSTTGWINRNRLVGVRFYPATSTKQADYGIEASLSIATAPGKMIDEMFELSTDGDSCWVTEQASLRPATLEEIMQLTAELPLAR